MVIKEQCAALVDLYDTKIMKCLEEAYRDQEKIGSLKNLLQPFEVEKLIETSADEEEFSKKLFKKLQASDLVKIDNERLYSEILAYLHRNMINSSLHEMLKCSDMRTKKSQFGLILSHLEGFLKYTDPTSVLSYLRSIASDSRDSVYTDVFYKLNSELNRIDKLENNEEEEEKKEERELEKKKIILRSVPQLGTFAALDIMLAIYGGGSPNRDNEARHFVDSVCKLKDGEFPNHFKSVREEQSIVVCDVDTLASDMMMSLGMDDLSDGLRHVNYRFDRVASYTTRRKVLNSIDPNVQTEKPIVLRNYQEELCRIAIQGINTIVTAPTGTGKTVVAAKIIKNHFGEKEKNEERFKALFMTPNTTILHQQAEQLRHYLGHAYSIKICQGAENSSTREAVLSNDIIVATPQMIVNLCNEHEDELSEFSDEKFYLSTFTIIVLDECHRTVSNSPNANIMREYHSLKSEGSLPTNQCLPQIVGLTASLGTGDGKNQSQVVDHIATMCSELDVVHMSMVRKYTEDLKQYSPIIPEKIDLFAKPTEGPCKEFSVSLMNMMVKIMRLLEAAFSNREDFSRVSHGDKIPLMDHPAYLNWLTVTRKNITEAHIQGDRNKINEALQLLENCYRTLCYNFNFNQKTAWTYLEEYIIQQEQYLTDEMKGIIQEYCPRLRMLSLDVSLENPMITRIERYLIENDDKNPSSRAIIFVQTRYEAMILKKILCENEQLQRRNIKADWIFGLNRTVEGREDSTVSRTEQLEKLKQFANGDIRVLVSTSVAEEGLDVSACNLVIKYNYATNVIAHVQRRGRGRAIDSRSILITNEKSLEDQENANKEREQLSERALILVTENLGAFESHVTRKIADIGPRIRAERTERIRINTMLETRNSTYQILCRKCDGLLCRSKDIRSRQDSQFLVCDPDFFKCITAKLYKGNPYATGSICHHDCHAAENCGSSIGQLVSVPGFTEMPALAAKKILLIDDANGARITVNQWKDIRTQHFKPDKIRELDVQMMRNARSKYITFEVQESNGSVEIVNASR